MVKTYPEMNAKIVDLLKMKDDPVSLYAAARIEELEKALDRACNLLKNMVFDCPPGGNCGNAEREGCDWDDCDKCWKKYFLEVSNDA